MIIVLFSTVLVFSCSFVLHVFSLSHSACSYCYFLCVIITTIILVIMLHVYNQIHHFNELQMCIKVHYNGKLVSDIGIPGK